MQSTPAALSGVIVGQSQALESSYYGNYFLPLIPSSSLPVTTHQSSIQAKKMSSAKEMRQWVTDQNGLDNVKQETAQVPEPGPDEVLVKVHAVSLNYRDTEGKTSKQQTKHIMTIKSVMAPTAITEAFLRAPCSFRVPTCLAPLLALARTFRCGRKVRESLPSLIRPTKRARSERRI